MRKIYLYTFIITTLALVIFASGCTSNTNQTNQSNVGNYSVNGLTFQYPVDWVITSQVRGNVQLITLFDGNFLESNATKGDQISIQCQPTQSNVTFDSVKKDLLNNTSNNFNQTNGTINISGINANLTTFTGTENGNQTQLKLVYFDKNNFTYIISFVVFGGVDAQSQQQYFDTVVNSFQAP